MLRACLPLRHNLRDKASNSHNTSFDTLSNIYRDAVRPSESRLPKVGESLRDLPLEGFSPAMHASPASPTTSHVGAPQISRGTKEKRPPPMTFSGRHPLPRRSGLQQEVLSLYKSLLAAAREKEHPQTVANLRKQIQSEFRQESGLERKHITKIEWLVHRGRNKLDELKAMPKTMRFSVFGA